MSTAFREISSTRVPPLYVRIRRPAALISVSRAVRAALIRPSSSSRCSKLWSFCCACSPKAITSGKVEPYLRLSGMEAFTRAIASDIVGKSVEPSVQLLQVIGRARVIPLGV